MFVRDSDYYTRDVFTVYTCRPEGGDHSKYPVCSVLAAINLCKEIKKAK